MPSVESFLTLEDSLQTRLMGKWQAIATPMVKRMTTQVLEQQPGAAFAEIEKLNLKRVTDGEQKFIKFHSVGSFLYGAANLTGDVNKTEAVRNGEVPEIIGPAMLLFNAMIEDIDRTLRISVADTIELTSRIVKSWRDERSKVPVTKTEAVKKSELPQPFDIKEFAEHFGPEIIVAEIGALEMREFIGVFMEERVAATGGSVVTAAASTHTSRLATYGFLTEAKLFDVTQYRVSEQLDGRTCKVCRRMHGEIFDVDDSYERLDGILRIDNPQTLKQASPWPSQSKGGLAELSALTNGQLKSRGLGFPPYHPNCRGVLLPVDGFSPPL
jgi:hypothetical protein